MVPIYAIESWLALRYKDNAQYWETMRECYEAYAIWSFFKLMEEYLSVAKVVRFSLVLFSRRRCMPLCWVYVCVAVLYVWLSQSLIPCEVVLRCSLFACRTLRRRRSICTTCFPSAACARGTLRGPFVDAMLDPGCACTSVCSPMLVAVPRWSWCVPRIVCGFPQLCMYVYGCACAYVYGCACSYV